MAGYDDDDITIGIDLGTTCSCVAVYCKGEVKVIHSEIGKNVTPSYVSFHNDGTRQVGEGAKSQAMFYPESTIYDVKRLMGKSSLDESVNPKKNHWPFQVTENMGMLKVVVKIGQEEKSFLPEEISAMILSKMRDIAVTYLGVKNIHKAVITVPAYFNHAQRQATIDAGKIAGLDILHILNEPTAAGIAYGLARQVERKIVLVFDLGGGTLDVSIMKVECNSYNVIAVDGDTYLGGEDFTNNLLESIIAEIKAETGFDITNDKKRQSKLRELCEEAKLNLSFANQADVIVDFLSDNVEFSTSITRARFEELNADMFESSLEPLKRAMKQSKLNTEDINEILMIGGSTRIPKIQELVSKYFGGKQLTKGINPDEAVAYGAAVDAAKYSSGVTQRLKNIVILNDVIPLSLGLKVNGGVMMTFIEKNFHYPGEKDDSVSTQYDDQKSACFQVYQGERPMVKDNVHMGSFTLTGIPKARAGVPHLKVCFEIDNNGILTVAAVDSATGNRKSLRIEHKGRLDEETIARMKDDAAKYRARDRKECQRHVARHQLETYAINMKGRLENAADAQNLQHSIKEFDQCLVWIKGNQSATKEEYEKQLMQLTQMCLKLHV